MTEGHNDINIKTCWLHIDGDRESSFHCALYRWHWNKGGEFIFYDYLKCSLQGNVYYSNSVVFLGGEDITI